MQVYDIPIDQQGKELTAVGTKTFPIAVYETQLSKNILGYVNWHWHEAIQLCLVTKGSVEVHINQQKHILFQGDGCFIHSNVLHMIRPHQDPNSTYICINAELPLIKGFSDSIIEKKYILPTMGNPDYIGVVLRGDHPGNKPILGSIQAIYKDDKERSFGYEIQITAELLKIWYNLILSHSHNVKTSFSTANNDSRLKVMISFMQNHYSEKITLEQVAAAVHLCPGECCRFFKRNMGKTIFQYLLEYRMEQSIQYLTQTSMSISDIAYACGFSSTSHYIDRFKKRTGLTPGEYRKHKK